MTDLILPGAKVLLGDCIARMKELPDQSVQMCVTSPPYFGLRDYGHEGQLGLEETPEQYIANMVAVFRVVRRVLADDGTLWINIGDSYAGSWGNQGRKSERGTQRPINGEMMQPVHDGRYPSTGSKTGSLERTPGCKNKDLIGIPWMLAFALRAGFSTCSTCDSEKRSDLWPVHNGHRVCIDCLMAGKLDSKVVQTEPGWYLRSEIVWHKPNPMPESVTDRPTKAHEQMFLLSKRPSYFYDHEAVKEPVAESQRGRVRSDKIGGNKGDEVHHSPGGIYVTGRKSMRNSFARVSKDSAGEHGQKPQFRPDRPEVHYDGEVRNRRSVWSIATKPYKGAHFAVFPPALVEPCILAGTSEKGHCPECGARWERVLSDAVATAGRSSGNKERKPRPGAPDTHGGAQAGSVPYFPTVRATTGWRATCDCGCEPVLDMVLDPFNGSGTTGAVAIQHGRPYIGTELNPDYLPLTRERLAGAIAAHAEVAALAEAASAQTDLFATL